MQKTSYILPFSKNFYRIQSEYPEGLDYVKTDSISVFQIRISRNLRMYRSIINSGIDIHNFDEPISSEIHLYFIRFHSYSTELFKFNKFAEKQPNLHDEVNRYMFKIC